MPGWSSALPPRATALAKGEACPLAGTWQVSQDICPEAERLTSLKIFSPSWAASDMASLKVALSLTVPPQALSASTAEPAPPLPFEIQVDGGVNQAILVKLAHHGVDIAVAGKAYFSAEDKAAFVAGVHGVHR